MKGKCKMFVLRPMSVALTLALLAAGCGGGSGVSGDTPMAIGNIDRSGLFSAVYPAFATTYDTTTVGQEFIDLLRQSHQGVEVIVVLGTWCGDSRREVPRFLRIADLAGIPRDSVLLIGVDRAKQAGDVRVDLYAIERVPTFIFMKGGREIGRIVETPATTLEGDMLTIFAGAQAP